MSKKKELYVNLKDAGMLEFGSSIPSDMVRQILGIEYPEVGTKKQFDEVALTELAAVDYVRNILLGEGKYLAGSQNGYRILLPSENTKQCERYQVSADKKLRRSIKLSRNTPAGDHSPLDTVTAKAIMKRESLRDEKRKLDLLK